MLWTQSKDVPCQSWCSIWFVNDLCAQNCLNTALFCTRLIWRVKQNTSNTDICSYLFTIKHNNLKYINGYQATIHKCILRLKPCITLVYHMLDFSLYICLTLRHTKHFDCIFKWLHGCITLIFNEKVMIREICYLHVTLIMYCVINLVKGKTWVQF